MSSVWLEISLVILLILLNGLLALSELALVSANKARLEKKAKDGDSKARIALELANSPDNFLSTIQIGITFIGILAGAFGGATIAELLSVHVGTYPLLEPYTETISVTIVVICITYLSLVLGELIPKRLALNNPEKLALLVAPMIKLLSRLANPLVFVLSGSTNALLRIFPFAPSTEPTITEEEIKLLIQKGTQAGTFQEFEQETIERVFRLADRKVVVLMTPRADIVWLDVNESIQESRRKIVHHKYSFYPVAQDAVDNIVGVVSGKELLLRTLEGKPFNLKEMSRKPILVYEMTPAVKVMQLFKKTGTHVAFVMDEFGVIQGIVTMGDILCSVFEEVEDTSEEIVAREDGSWLIAGSLPLDELIDYVETGEISEEERAKMNTVGGFVMSKIGAVPSEGQHFVWRGLRFEVVDMDGRRVDKVLVSRIHNEAEKK